MFIFWSLFQDVFAGSKSSFLLKMYHLQSNVLSIIAGPDELEAKQSAMVVQRPFLTAATWRPANVLCYYCEFSQVSVTFDKASKITHWVSLLHSLLLLRLVDFINMINIISFQLEPKKAAVHRKCPPREITRSWPSKVSSTLRKSLAAYIKDQWSLWRHCLSYLVLPTLIAMLVVGKTFLLANLMPSSGLYWPNW